MKFYIVLKDGADRPYVSSYKPSKERQAALLEQGCELMEVDVAVPGWEWKHGKVIAVAEPMRVE